MTVAMENAKSSRARRLKLAFDAEHLRGQPELAALAAELLWRANQSETAAGFLAQGLPLVLQAAAAEFAAVAALEGGRWQRVAEFGPPRKLAAATLLADALDREQAVANGGWVAAPLAAHAASGEVLLLFLSPQHMRRVSRWQNSRRWPRRWARRWKRHARASTSGGASSGWKRF